MLFKKSLQNVELKETHGDVGPVDGIQTVDPAHSGLPLEYVALVQVTNEKPKLLQVGRSLFDQHF